MNPRALVATLVVAITAMSGWFLVTGTQAPASAATIVSSSSCRAYDPNLVSGVCLSYPGSDGGTYFTWLGTYRAANGKVFFCIDFRYDSSMAGAPRVVSTANLRNQLGRSVGSAEVAALNYLIGRWAPSGSTGDANRDAAIALIIREVMSDGVTENGVVYPPGLKVGGSVSDPIGGLGGTVLALARSMWAGASAFRGPWQPRLTFAQSAAQPVGVARRFDVALVSAGSRMVGGETISFTCTGPIRCPRPVVSGGQKVRTLSVTPTNVGRYTIAASVLGAPSANGLLYDVGWSPHGGSLATISGPQRGWIATSNTERASVAANSVAVPATPQVSTKSSVGSATGNTALADVVTVSGLPAGFTMRAQATLWGPFASRPTVGNCVGTKRVRTVSFDVKGNGTFRTPKVMTRGVGFYTWTNQFPKTGKTNAVNTACGIPAEITRILAYVPRVVTQASDAEVVGDVELTDKVTVSGLPSSGYKVTALATLWGPFASRPTSTSCVASSKVGTVAVAVTKNGIYRTPAIRTRGPGYYVWTEELPKTPMVNGVTTPCGLATETTLRSVRPKISTTASSNSAVPGDSIFDTYVVTDAEGLALTGTWTLLGPLPAHSGSCSDLDWSSAAVRDSGSISVTGDGRYRTTSTTVTDRGCYTYAEHLNATEFSPAVDSAPGQVSETVVVGLLQPTLTTQVSSQRSIRGDSVRDTVVVDGSGSSSIVVRWSLLGPVQPDHGSCAGVSWASAPTASTGTLTTTGDGTYVTEPVKVQETGCYTYVETADATSRTLEVATSPGEVDETTLVTTRRPSLRTRVSSQHALAGSRIFDSIDVRGLGDGDQIKVTWSLLGPIAPGDHRCRALDWSRAPRARHGLIVVRANGLVRTPAVRLDKPGCYTYVESAPETVTTARVISPPGQETETLLITRPPIPVVPVIPTGAAGWEPRWVATLLEGGRR